MFGGGVLQAARDESSGDIKLNVDILDVFPELVDLLPGGCRCRYTRSGPARPCVHESVYGKLYNIRLDDEGRR